MTVNLSTKQKEILRRLKEYDLLFVTGAAGTGKTYAACLAALEALDKGQVDKIIICRPLVSTEPLGFLPGDVGEKVDPYLEPLIDVLVDITNGKYIRKLRHEGSLIIAPLAFMRGKTLKNAFIILDEAQNTTKTQMSMFLTRFGDNIKCCVIGDLKQSDIGYHNGLRWSTKILRESSLIGFVDLGSDEVVRSELVKDILKFIYAEDENEKNSSDKNKRATIEELNRRRA